MLLSDALRECAAAVETEDVREYDENGTAAGGGVNGVCCNDRGDGEEERGWYREGDFAPRDAKEPVSAEYPLTGGIESDSSERGEIGVCSLLFCLYMCGFWWDGSCRSG